MSNVKRLLISIELKCACVFKPDVNDGDYKCSCEKTAKNVILDQIRDDVSDKVRCSCTDLNGDCHVSLITADVVD